jgi:hypothetical protein
MAEAMSCDNGFDRFFLRLIAVDDEVAIDDAGASKGFQAVDESRLAVNGSEYLVFYLTLHALSATGGE